MSRDFQAEFEDSPEGRRLTKRYNAAIDKKDWDEANAVWMEWDEKLAHYVATESAQDAESKGLEEFVAVEIINELTMVDSLRKDINKNIEELNDRFLKLRDLTRDALGYD